MNALVRIAVDDGGEEKRDGEVWHLVDQGNPCGAATLCEGEFFGFGESGCVYEQRTVMRGGITCPKCLDRVKIYKAVRL